MSRRDIIRCLCLAALCGALGCTSLREWTRDAATLPTPLGESQVVGRVSAAGDGAPLGHAAVFLEPIDGRHAAKPLAAAVMSEQVGGFEPDFVVVVVGQPVEFINDDEIFHGVFSYSRPNSFARRPFAPGQSRTVSFQHPGVVRAYCPLHLTMPS